MVLKIAHQVVRSARSRALGEGHCPPQKQFGSSRIRLQRCVMPCKGEMTRDAVEGCQGASAGGGCPTRAWTRRERQREGSAAGGHPHFWGDTYPAILVPSLAPTSCRKRTGAGLHEHPMRDLAKPGPARRPGAFPQKVRARGRFADRASGEAGMVGCGALRRERCSRKNADGSLPGVHPPAVPDVLREARCAPPLPTRRTRCRAW